MTTSPTTIRARAHRALAFLSLTASVAALQARPYGTPGGTPSPPADDDEGGRTRSFESLLTRYGNSEAAGRELFQDNFRYREANRTLKAENAQLKAAQPQEGQLVLTKEQVADWTEYQKLGKPAEAAKKITDGGAAIEAGAKRDRGDKLAAAAKAVGWKPEVLTQLAEMHGLELSSQEVDPGDGAAKVTVYSVKNAAGVQTELQQYATQNWGDFLPALKAAPGTGAPAGGTPPVPGTPPAGQPWLPGGGVTNTGPVNNAADLTKMADDLMKGRDAAGPNPLQRAASGGAPVTQNGGRLGGPGTAPPAGGEGTSGQ